MACRCSSACSTCRVSRACFARPRPRGRRFKDRPASSRTDAHETDSTPLAARALSGDLPPLDQLIESGKVLALNMPAGTNPALARAVGVMLKNAWLQSLLLRPAKMKDAPGRYVRPAVFICDEYQAFASVAEDDPSGDEKAFALTRQCRVIPIVATQSISSLRSVLGSGEAWRTLLQTLRTRIFLSLSDEASAEIASKLCGQVAKIKSSYTINESAKSSGINLMSAQAGGGRGSVGASKSFQERREALFQPRDFALLGNCQAICLPVLCPRSGRQRVHPQRSAVYPTWPWLQEHGEPVSGCLTHSRVGGANVHRAIAALAIAVASTAVPVDAQEMEITAGAGLGLELFDENVLTYPTADLGLTHWWANGWGLGGRGTFQIGTVLHPYSQGVYSTAFNQPPGTRFIGVSGSTRVAVLVRRRWFPRGTEIDVGFGWAFFWHTDRTLLPDRRIGKVRHGSSLTFRGMEASVGVRSAGGATAHREGRRQRLAGPAGRSASGAAESWASRRLGGRRASGRLGLRMIAIWICRLQRGAGR